MPTLKLAHALTKRALEKRNLTRTTSIIVIVVVIVSLVASIVFCFFIFWLIRRRQKRVDAQVKAAVANGPVGAKVPVQTIRENQGLRGGEYQGPELDGRMWVEMEGSTPGPRAEMDGTVNLKAGRMEMEGSPVYGAQVGARTWGRAG